MIRYVATMIFLAAVAVTAAQAQTQPGVYLSGIATVVDGDTIDLDQTHRIRLFGINAPEVSDFGGQISKNVMIQLVADARVTCRVVDIDRYDRHVAVCMLNESDIGASMVALGWALNADRYTQDYQPYEDWAYQNCSGLWAAVCGHQP